LNEHLGISILNDIIGLRDYNITKFKNLFYNQEHIIGGGDMKVDYKPKHKLFNAMDSTDKDGVVDSSEEVDNMEMDTNTQDLDKGKEKEVDSTSKNRYPGGIDPAILVPKHINPGPGFNVPGGKVPIRDAICQHIDYNSHILNQLSNMSLETAITQKDNNLVFIKVLVDKIGYAQDALSKVPVTPTNDYEFRLRNKILKDLESFNKDKMRAEAKLTLINSRLEFIQNNINK
jgi:hypothetical protein